MTYSGHATDRAGSTGQAHADAAAPGSGTAAAGHAKAAVASVHPARIRLEDGGPGLSPLPGRAGPPIEPEQVTLLLGKVVNYLLSAGLELACTRTCLPVTVDDKALERATIHIDAALADVRRVAVRIAGRTHLPQP